MQHQTIALSLHSVSPSHACKYILTPKAGQALCIFDHCLLMEKEWNCIWRRQYTTASALYVTLQLVTVSLFALTLVQNVVTLDCKVSYNMVLIDASRLTCLVAD